MLPKGTFSKSLQRYNFFQYKMRFLRKKYFFIFPKNYDYYHLIDFQFFTSSIEIYINPIFVDCFTHSLTFSFNASEIIFFSSNIFLSTAFSFPGR